MLRPSRRSSCFLSLAVYPALATTTRRAVFIKNCRFVGKAEVLETLAKGRVNDRKSQPGERPCPKYVVDAAVGPRRKNVQCVFTDCPDATNVITVIDTDTNWACPPC